MAETAQRGVGDVAAAERTTATINTQGNRGARRRTAIGSGGNASEKRTASTSGNESASGSGSGRRRKRVCRTFSPRSTEETKTRATAALPRSVSRSEALRRGRRPLARTLQRRTTGSAKAPSRRHQGAAREGTATRTRVDRRGGPLVAKTRSKAREGEAGRRAVHQSRGDRGEHSGATTKSSPAVLLRTTTEGEHSSLRKHPMR